MSQQANRDKMFFVAPAEAPPARRPPITEVGLLRWMRENLFKTTVDTVLTVIMAVLLLLGLSSFLGWALFEAQWEVNFMNLRAINIGPQFPQSETWRADAIAMIVIFLTLMSVAVWGRLSRTIVGVLVLLGVLMIVLPPMAEVVQEPPVHLWIESDYDLRQANFIAQEDQTIVFTIDPLTQVEDYLITNIDGYVENNKQTNNTSFDAFAAAGTDVTFLETRDPSLYDLRVAVQVLDATGEQIYQSDFTDGTPESTIFEWTAPDSDWYTITMVLAENSGEQGAAWLLVDEVEVLIDTNGRSREREAIYGPPPVLDCNNCATNLYRTDVRFQGQRSLPQWFSLQLAPFLVEVRGFFFLALVVGAAGYGAGMAAKNQSLQSLVDKLRPRLRLLSLVLFAVYIVLQLFSPLFSSSFLSQVYAPVLIAFCITMILWSVMLLLDSNRSRKSNGLSLLWLSSFPVISLLLNGISGSAILPVLSTSHFGGLLLTVLLSAVAIAFSLPIGLMLALGRQSPLPVVSILCTVFIEVLRGVPLITLLFMGRLILPFFGFGLGDVDLVIRTMVVMTLFTAAYMAEVVRGGLQIVPKGQFEAAHALGLNDFYTTIHIVLPQAVRAVIPAIMGQAVSLFKDSSLVFIIGLFEVLGVMSKIILADSLTGYTQFAREGYLFVGMIYFVFCYIMADVSRRLERTGSGAVRRDRV